MDFQKLEFLTAVTFLRAKMRHHAKFREDRSNRSGDGGRPPSWICFTRVGTNHEEYLVVFVIVQNLVVIGAVISIVCKF